MPPLCALAGHLERTIEESQCASAEMSLVPSVAIIEKFKQNLLHIIVSWPVNSAFVGCTFFILLE